MFLALAIVCDEFFVPALEVMVDTWQIEDDVAGATFMAAGGSAPELFTSLISVFMAPPSASDTGFGTIVGSAVFNVLFVIGMCAIFSKEVLTLTWWPLARDSSYYTVGLLALAMFFLFGKKKNGQNQIEWFESLVLLTLYVGYVVFMKFHLKVQIFLVRHCYCRKKKPSKSNTSVSPQRVMRQQSSRSALIVKLKEQEATKLTSPMNFRAGVLHLIVSKKPLLETAGMHMVTKIQGDVRETFLELSGKEPPEGCITRDDLKKMLLGAGLEENITDEEIQKAFEKLDKNQDGLINWTEFSIWYKSSEAKIWADADRVFDAIDKNGDGHISRGELIYLLEQVLCRPPSFDEVDGAWLEMLAQMSKADLEEESQKPSEKDEDEEMRVPKDLFKEWFAKVFSLKIELPQQY